MLNFGDIVQVKAFPNQVLERQVVSVKNSQTVLLCNEEEFQAALKEDRAPSSIGFPIHDIIEDKTELRKAA